MRRANEYRDAGNLLFEPRFLDAEKALDAGRRNIHNSADESAFLLLDACLEDLTNYRRSAADAIDSADGVKDLDGKPKARRMQITQELRALTEKVGKEIDGCIADADSFIRQE